MQNCNAYFQKLTQTRPWLKTRLTAVTCNLPVNAMQYKFTEGKLHTPYFHRQRKTCVVVFYRFRHLPSNGAIARIALRDHDLHFEGKNLKC